VWELARAGKGPADSPAQAIAKYKLDLPISEALSLTPANVRRIHPSRGRFYGRFASDQEWLRIRGRSAPPVAGTKTSAARARPADRYDHRIKHTHVTHGLISEYRRAA